MGHVFQGRYKAILVEKEGYLLELARYVVLNPLRAGMTQNVADWPWSSYSAMVGTVPSPDWLETDWFLGQFSPQRTTAREQYINFVRAGVGLTPIWGNLRNQIYLGDEAFVTQIQALNPENQQLSEVPRLQRRLNAKPLADYKTEYAEQPQLGMARAYLSGKYAMKEIAEVFAVHYTTVSRAIKNHEMLHF